MLDCGLIRQQLSLIISVACPSLRFDQSRGAYSDARYLFHRLISNSPKDLGNFAACAFRISRNVEQERSILGSSSARYIIMTRQGAIHKTLN